MAHLQVTEQANIPLDNNDALSSDIVDDILRDVVIPMLAAMEFDDNDENLTNLMFNTMITNFRPSKKSYPGPCEVCNGRHDADTCRVPGSSFLTEWLLKNVKQYNSVHGDKPKVTLPNIPPPPRKPSFGSMKNKLEKRNMKIE